MVAIHPWLEFHPWADIPDDRKRGTGEGREVLGETFKGEPAWLPWMGARVIRAAEAKVAAEAAETFICSVCGRGYTLRESGEHDHR